MLKYHHLNLHCSHSHTQQPPPSTHERTQVGTDGGIQVDCTTMASSREYIISADMVREEEMFSARKPTSELSAGILYLTVLEDYMLTVEIERYDLYYTFYYNNNQDYNFAGHSVVLYEVLLRRYLLAFFPLNFVDSSCYRLRFSLIIGA